MHATATLRTSLRPPGGGLPKRRAGVFSAHSSVIATASTSRGRLDFPPLLLPRRRPRGVTARGLTPWAEEAEADPDPEPYIRWVGGKLGTVPQWLTDLKNSKDGCPPAEHMTEAPTDTPDSRSKT